MLKALLKVRLSAFGAMLTGTGKNKGKSSTGKKIAFAVLMLYVGGAFGSMLFGLLNSIAPAFTYANLEWLYFTFYALISFGLMAVGSVFTAKSQLFEARDNDLMLSLPITPRMILFSRIFSIILLNAMYGLLVFIPAFIVWFFAQGQTLSVVGFLAFLLISIGLNLLATAVACLLGALLSAITSRMRNKETASTILSFVFLGLYFWFYSSLTKKMPDLIANPDKVAHAFNSTVILKYFGSAITEGNLLQLLIALAVTVIPFVIVYAVISARFISIVTTKRSAAKKKYVERELNVASPKKALLKQQFSHFLSSSSYVTNCGLGIVLMVAAGVALLILQGKLMPVIASFKKSGASVVPLATLAIGLILSMSVITAPSISIEGKSIWLLRSLPLSSREILQTKLNMSNIMLVPAALFMSICCCIVLRTSSWLIVFLFIVPVLLALLNSNMGLIANLRHPFMDWTSEMQAVKQSTAVLIAMLISASLVIIPGALYFLAELYRYDVLFMVGYTLILGLLFVLSQLFINKKGVELFERL